MPKKPEPFDLVNADGEVIATACVKRPPGRREPEWYWQAPYTDPRTGERCNTTLGRLADHEVGDALRAKLRELIPGLVEDDSSGIHTLDALVEAWAAWQETRGSNGSKQITDSTVTAYLGNASRLAPYIKGIECRTLNRSRYRSIREAMDKECDSRRTVNGDMKSLKQAIIWGRELGVVIPSYA